MGFFKKDPVQMHESRIVYLVFQLDDSWFPEMCTIIRQPISSTDLGHLISSGVLVCDDRAEKSQLAAFEDFIKQGSIKRASIKSPLGFSDTLVVAREIGTKANVQFTIAVYTVV